MQKARRIFAIIGLILIAALYILTFVFAIMKSPASKDFLMAAVFCTIVLPVILYAIGMVTKSAADRAKKEAEENEEK